MLTKRDLRYNFGVIHFTTFLGILPFSLDRYTGKAVVKENDFWARLPSRCVQLVELSYATFAVCRVIYFTLIHPTWHIVKTPASIAVASALTVLFISSLIVTDHIELFVKLYNGLFNMHRGPGKTNYSTIEQLVLDG